MKTNKDIQDKIDATLDSVDSINVINTSPFFKDKTMQRLFARKEERRAAIWPWFTPQHQLVTLIVIVALNVFAITQLDSNGANDDIDEFAQTYHLSTVEYQSIFN
ncbi:hypothetical protein A9Q86_04660 [Flavobacteriales bacterium 33_180_T64]|nr:hypothetical protein A9Q86_04660 [Flavobacteriales bacterium 33_180_T64]